MTDEELEMAIRDVCESIDNLPESDEPLPKEEKRRRGMLLVRKEVLDKIKMAKEKNGKDAEIYNTAVYSLLTSWGERHPFWMHIVLRNLRWGVF